MTRLTTDYFVRQFRAMTTQELMEHIATRDLVESARDAVRMVLTERGVTHDESERLWHDALKSHLRKSGVTNQCDFCGHNTALGSIADGDQRFCSSACLREARLLEASIDLAPDLISEHALALRSGPCPVCRNQRSMVEVRKSYVIVSAVVLAHRSVSKELCCKSCGTRQNLVAALVCALAGWWSVYGLFATLPRIFKNLSIAYQRDRSGPPSPELMYRARLDLAEKLIAAGVLGSENRPFADSPRPQN